MQLFHTFKKMQVDQKFDCTIKIINFWDDHTSLMRPVTVSCINQNQTFICTYEKSTLIKKKYPNK